MELTYSTWGLEPEGARQEPDRGRRRGHGGRRPAAADAAIAPDHSPPTVYTFRPPERGSAEAPGLQDGAQDPGPAPSRAFALTAGHLDHRGTPGHDTSPGMQAQGGAPLPDPHRVGADRSEVDSGWQNVALFAICGLLLVLILDQFTRIGIAIGAARSAAQMPWPAGVPSYPVLP